MKYTALLLFGLLINGLVYSQNVGVGTTTPDESAALDVVSNDKGLLIPRTDTTTVNASGVTLAEGLMIYDPVEETFFYYNGNNWELFITSDNEEGDDLGDHTATQNIALDNQFISNDGDNEGVRVFNNGNVDVTGEIEFTADNYFPVAAEKTTLVIHGRANPDGTVDTPFILSLYTVDRVANGVYSIKFPNGTFAAPPVATVTCRDLAGEVRIASIQGSNPNEVRVTTKKIDGGNEDSGFDFIVVGIR